MLREKLPDGNIHVDTSPVPRYHAPVNPCRLARTDDAPAIQAIYEPVVRQTAISFEYEVPDVAEIEARMRSVQQARPWLVYEDGGAVLGYSYAAVFRDRRAYDWSAEVSIYVHASAQRRGIGRTLYRTLFDVLRAQGYWQAIAGATVPNACSERLHESLGFQLIGRFPAVGYKFGAWYDVVFWRLPLCEAAADAPSPVININELIREPEWAWLIKS